MDSIFDSAQGFWNLGRLGITQRCPEYSGATSSHAAKRSSSRFYSFLQRKGDSHGPWQQFSEGKLLEIALLASSDVSHNVEARLAEVPLLPALRGLNTYLLSLSYFLGNLFYTPLNENLQLR